MRLCFQVFIENPESEQTSFSVALPPVVSDPIYDKKAISELVISRLSDASGTVAGGKEIILLCEKVSVALSAVKSEIASKHHSQC